MFSRIFTIFRKAEVPEDVKPWGTGHAVLSCINEIDGPFSL